MRYLCSLLGSFAYQRLARMITCGFKGFLWRFSISTVSLDMLFSFYKGGLFSRYCFGCFCVSQKSWHAGLLCGFCGWLFAKPTSALSHLVLHMLRTMRREAVREYALALERRSI